MISLEWFRWQHAVDFLALVVGVYVILQWARGTRVLRIVLGVLGLHAAGRIAWKLDLTITGWLLDIASVLLVLMLLFFFQPELRHAFMRLDSVLGLGLRTRRGVESGAEAISETAHSLAAARIGALIVIARRDSLRELVSGGIALGAQVSSMILSAIFQKTSPLHDGAVLIEGDVISRAGAVLPLTLREDVPAEYGTRHRAAMGIADRCDALVVVVSEERGEVTLMHGYQRSVSASAAQLAAWLKKLSASSPKGVGARLKRWFFADLRYKFAACGIAGLLWIMSIMGGATVRVFTVPIEFSGVPPGLEIRAQSAMDLEVQMRGASWMMASMELTGLAARFDLRGAREGPVTLKAGPDNLSLPPGVTVDRVRPDVITVRLAGR